jgi:hypothetical protein
MIVGILLASLVHQVLSATTAATWGTNTMINTGNSDITLG